MRAYAAGWRVLEIPFDYPPNAAVPSKAHASLGVGVPAHVLVAVEAAQLDSRPPTTTTARTTARSRCSATGSAALPAHHRADRRARARCSTSGAARATSSARCRRAASRSTSWQQAAVRAAVRLPRVRGSGFALPFADASFPVRAVLAGDRARADGTVDDRRAVPRARSRADGWSSARRTTTGGNGYGSRRRTAWPRRAATPTSTSRTTRGRGCSRSSRDAATRTRRRATSSAAS